KMPLSEKAKELGTDEDTLEATLAFARRKLLEVRGRRVPPGKDDKVIASWNGLMIDTLAKASVVLRDPAYGQAATKALDVLWEKLWTGERLLHQMKAGFGMLDGYLDDYANLSMACLSLFELDGDLKWMERARTLMDTVLSDFWDGQGAFYYTSRGHEKLILR